MRLGMIWLWMYELDVWPETITQPDFKSSSDVKEEESALRQSPTSYELNPTLLNADWRHLIQPRKLGKVVNEICAERISELCKPCGSAVLEIMWRLLNEQLSSCLAWEALKPQQRVRQRFGFGGKAEGRLRNETLYIQPSSCLKDDEIIMNLRVNLDEGLRGCELVRTDWALRIEKWIISNFLLILVFHTGQGQFGGAGMEAAYQILNKPFRLGATGETTRFHNLVQKTERLKKMKGTKQRGGENRKNPWQHGSALNLLSAHFLYKSACLGWAYCLPQTALDLTCQVDLHNHTSSMQIKDFCEIPQGSVVFPLLDKTAIIFSNRARPNCSAPETPGRTSTKKAWNCPTGKLRLKVSCCHTWIKTLKTSSIISYWLKIIMFKMI